MSGFSVSVTIEAQTKYNDPFFNKNTANIGIYEKVCPKEPFWFLFQVYGSYSSLTPCVFRGGRNFISPLYTPPALEGYLRGGGVGVHTIWPRMILEN